MTLEQIKTLFDFDRWATQRILEVASALQPEKYLQDLASSHGGIHGTFVHAFAADTIWLERLTGAPRHPMITAAEIPNLATLREEWNRWRGSMDEYLGTLSDARLLEGFSHQDSKGNSYTYPLYYVLQHLVNHSTYHRGQVVSMLRQQGAKPVNTDLISFYRMRARS